MGFSVSGSFAILVLASFIAFGMLHAAGSNSFERVTDATQDSYERGLDQQNTAIEIAEINTTGSHIDVNVSNVGTTTLSLNSTDVFVDGVYQEDLGQFRIAKDPNARLWFPGEKLFVRIQVQPNSAARVQIVTEHGIAVVAEV